MSKAILGVKILSRRVNSCLGLWPILQVNSATSTLSNVSAYLNELNWSALSGSNYWLLWSWIGDMYELYLQFITIRRLHWILQLRTVWRNVSQQFSQGFPLCEYNQVWPGFFPAWRLTFTTDAAVKLLVFVFQKVQGNKALKVMVVSSQWMRTYMVHQT